MIRNRTHRRNQGAVLVGADLRVIVRDELQGATGQIEVTPLAGRNVAPQRSAGGKLEQVEKPLGNDDTQLIAIGPH